MFTSKNVERAMNAINRKPHNNDQAPGAQRLRRRQDRLRGLLARLQRLSDNHFAVLPDEMTWSHVTSITDSAALLRRITDAWFSEGEHAA